MAKAKSGIQNLFQDTDQKWVSAEENVIQKFLIIKWIRYIASYWKFKFLTHGISLFLKEAQWRNFLEIMRQNLR